VCGIAGYVGRESETLLPAMLRSLAHRGPDDSGSFVAPGVGLGMTRLAIIDLESGRQPMQNEDGSLAIVFNGEIYNHRELRPALERAGHRFRTRSDTEVILHLFEERGPACVEELRGMFAFAIWSSPGRTLFLARDRLGKKPLYYWRRGEGLLFASEPKALLCHPDLPREVDPDALHHYLAFGYTPGEASIFRALRKLPPAHRALFHGGRLEAERYWSLPAAPEPIREPGEARRRIRDGLREAVRLRLESDVPLGVFLSGGIDSSAIVACMRELTAGRIATFSIGFGSAAPSFDELPYARQVAARFQTDHHEEILEPKVADLLEPIVRGFDEPFADSSAVPTYVVSQATARHVKVALSGVGGDEAFAGYPRYLGVRLSERYAALPAWLRAAGNWAGRTLLRESDRSRNLGDWARRFANGSALPMPARYLGWTRFFGQAELEELVAPELCARFAGEVEAPQRAAYALRGHGDPVDGAFRIDLTSYLPDDLLAMADRMSMAHSLELRAPFCDHRLLETSLAIAPGLKLPGRRLKGLLKAAYADILPPEVLRHRKQGFMIPLGRWLRTDLRDAMEDLLSPASIRTRGLFQPGAVARLKQEHLEGSRSHSDRLWTLMMLELWMRYVLERGAGGNQP